MGEPGFESQEGEFSVDEEQQTIVVKKIFTKAQQEHAYAAFYAQLCQDIVRLELLMRGQRPTLTNAKNCTFRRKLLDYCKEYFDLLLAHKEDNQCRENESEEDRKERELRTKHKLFGNIEFVGELFKF